MVRRQRLGDRRLKASPKGGAAVGAGGQHFRANEFLGAKFQSHHFGAERMEVLSVLVVPFLVQLPPSSLALVQTNLGLGLGLVTNSEAPAHQHRHLVR